MSRKVHALIPIDTEGRPTNFPIALFDTLPDAEAVLEELKGDYVIMTYTI